MHSDSSRWDSKARTAAGEASTPPGGNRAMLVNDRSSRNRSITSHIRRPYCHASGSSSHAKLVADATNAILKMVSAAKAVPEDDVGPIKEWLDERLTPEAVATVLQAINNKVNLSGNGAVPDKQSNHFMDLYLTEGA